MDDGCTERHPEFKVGACHIRSKDDKNHLSILFSANQAIHFKNFPTDGGASRDTQTSINELQVHFLPICNLDRLERMQLPSDVVVSLLFIKLPY